MLIQSTVPILERWNMYCPNCGSVAEAKRHTKGSFLVELLLWLCFLVPGLIYSIWRLTTRSTVCGVCKSSGVIPENSPRAKEALAKPR
jgi:hypothetical protein